MLCTLVSRKYTLVYEGGELRRSYGVYSTLVSRFHTLVCGGRSYGAALRNFGAPLRKIQLFRNEGQAGSHWRFDQELTQGKLQPVPMCDNCNSNLRGVSEPILVNKIMSQKTPLETSRFSRRKKNRMARGVSPPRHPICCSHVRTASTYKLAIARDDCVHHVLPIPPSVEVASVAGDGLSLVKPFSFSGF